MSTAVFPIAKSHKWLQYLSACLGNLFEHYDMALFGLLSPFLAPLIFPQHDPVTALILSYGMIPLSMLVRPLGSIIFGYIGDFYGREQALFYSLLGMSIISGCLAFAPTHQHAGALAPLIFLLARIIQYFLAAGETIGGAIYLLESTSQKKHDFLSGLYGSTTIGGHLLASFGVYYLSAQGWIHDGWRFLYLAGSVTGVFGCLLRFSIRKTTLPSRKILSSTPEIWKAFLSHRKEFFMIVLSSGLGYASFSISLVLMNGFLPLITSLTKSDVMEINTFLLVIDLLVLPLFGWLASKISREKVMLIACVGISLTAIPLSSFLEGATWKEVAMVRIVFVLFGALFFAPYHAWVQQLVPQRSRYVLISLGYALGAQLIGSPTAAIALWLYKITGVVSSVVWYWVALALINGFLLIKIRSTDNYDKESNIFN